MRRKLLLDFLLPVVFLMILTIVWTTTDCDIKIERLFYTPEHGWVYHNNVCWTFLYRYGTFPAILLAAVSFSALLLSFFDGPCRSWRRRALFFVLLMLIGPGLLVNVALKESWGRSRPREVTLFGGQQPYTAVIEKGRAGMGKSFPSGHAAMGFYLLSPYFAFRRTSPRQSRFFLVLGLLYGLVMGLGRMIQGGHFATDVIWAGGIVYLCGAALYYLLGLDREGEMPKMAAYGPAMER